MHGYPQSISPSGYHASMLWSPGMQVRLGSVHVMNTLLVLLALAALTDCSPKREHLRSLTAALLLRALLLRSRMIRIEELIIGIAADKQ